MVDPIAPQGTAPRWMPYALGITTGVVVGLIVLLFALGTGRIGRASSSATGFANSAQPGTATSGITLPASRRNAIVSAVERMQSSVVTISAAGTRTVTAPLPEVFRFPFRVRQTAVMQWVGSGFLVDTSGYVVTTAHVVRDAEDVVVSLGDGSSAHAVIVGSAPRFDLALLRVEGSDLRFAPAQLGRSDDLMVGEWAIAIGSPFGNKLDDPQPSVSVGVISAVNRDIRPPKRYPGSWPYFDLLQTDAAINAGNSGGPLVNADGEVIGVNMAIIATAAGLTNVGVNFSIPINTVKWVVDELREYGELRIPWLGWRLDEVIPAEERRRIQLPDRDGVVRVGRIEPGGPADRAGISAGDIVLAINNQDPYSRSRANRILFDTRVGGEPISVLIIRGGDGQQVTVVVEVLENPVTQRERETRRARPLG
jgi:serine protease Do